MTTEFWDEDDLPVPEAAPTSRPEAKRGRTEGVAEWWYECPMTWVDQANMSPAKFAETYFVYVATIALGSGADPTYAWLMPAKDCNWKVSLLVELGRLGDEATIRERAAELCATRPKIRDALESLRMRRTGEQPRPPKPLAEAIVRLVETHLDRNPATPSDEVRDALVRAGVLLDRRLGERD